MSDKLTRIRLHTIPHGEGFMDWGDLPRETMIAHMRRRSAHMRKIADAIDAAEDDEFDIDVIRGSVVQHLVRRVQTGKRK